MLEINVNGEATALPDKSTVRDLLGLMQLTARRVAVELNREIIPRSLHEQTVLRDGDTVEVVQAIGGG